MKPVAWCNEHGRFVIGSECPNDVMNSWKPVYDAPKELTADEMYEIAKQFLKSYYTPELVIAMEDWYEFARAILRKAQE